MYTMEQSHVRTLDQRLLWNNHIRERWNNVHNGTITCVYAGTALTLEQSYMVTLEQRLRWNMHTCTLEHAQRTKWRWNSHICAYWNNHHAGTLTIALEHPLRTRWNSDYAGTITKMEQRQNALEQSHVDVPE